MLPRPELGVNSTPSAGLRMVTSKKPPTAGSGGRDIGISGVSPIVKRLTLQEDIPVILQADEGASHGVFARVYGEAKLAGAKSINFSTKR